MTTLISHFRNEEYLLPWWLRHHVPMFDHGVMIDYHSDDASLDIIRELAPSWEIRTTRIDDFYVENNQISEEVMEIEHEFDGWKMCLNTTEFLCGDLVALEKNLSDQSLVGARIRPFAMVDPPEMRDVEPDPLRSLVHECHYGFADPCIADRPPAARLVHPVGLDWRSRLLHCSSDGRYGGGRHSTSLPDITPDYPWAMAILWFAYAPWTPGFRARKRQIWNRFPVRTEPECGWDAEMEEWWGDEQGLVVDLLNNPEFVAAVHQTKRT